MKGKVVSYISSKKYGFINGDDGESYFLHFSALLDKLDEAKLVKNVVVEFDPTPNPKGLAAKKVRVPTVYFKKEMVDFFTTRAPKPKYGTVEKQHSIECRFIKGLDEAREHIETLAKDAGCNAILNMSFEKETFNSGNYRYTVHAFKGDFAIVTDQVPCDSVSKANQSIQDLQSKIDYFDALFFGIKSEEDKVRAKQLEKSNIGWFILGGILLFILLLAAGT
ncbi:cold-shock protein [Vibrio cyclitrophicus]